MYEASTYAILTAKLYTRKLSVMMESLIVYFYQGFYIPVIHKILSRLPHVRILGTCHYVNMHKEALKCCSYFHDVLFRRDYAKHVLASFANQNHPEYFCGNSYVSI